MKKDRSQQNKKQKYSLLKQVAAPVVILDIKGRIVFINPAGEKTFGYSDRELKGTYLWNTFSMENDAAEIKHILTRLKDKKQTKQIETCATTKKGEKKTVSWSLALCSENREEIKHFAATASTFCKNRKTENDVSRDQQNILKKGSFSGEVRHVRKDGTELPAMMNNSLLKDKEENPADILGTMQDITETQKIRTELKQSESLYHTTINAMESGVCILNSQLNILFCNRTIYNWSKQFKFSDNFTGRNYFDAFPFVSYAAREEFDTIRKTGKTVISDHTLRLNNRKIFYRSHRIPVFKANELVRFVVVIEENTEQKLSEQAMIRSSRIEATATLAGGIAHDFNNLMSVVSGNAELLYKKFPGDPQAEDLITNIVNGAQKGGELAQHLLAFARGGKYHPEFIDFNEVIEDNFTLHKGTLPENVEVELNLSKDLWTVKADTVQMGQVLINIFINASEAIKKQGKVIISTENTELENRNLKTGSDLNTGKYVCLSISDTGCGMNKKTKNRLFEPFFSTKKQGHGLGLSAVHGIVKNHNGQITVHTKPGKGSTFKVYLPAVKEKPVNKKEPETVRYTETSTANETILVVDDDTSVRNITEKMLKHLNYNVLTACNGKEAIKTLCNHKETIHCALLDMKMPVMDGRETFSWFQKHSPETKIIIFTGYEKDDNAQYLLKNGASSFIQKPFKIDTLSETIKNSLESSS